MPWLGERDWMGLKAEGNRGQVNGRDARVKIGTNPSSRLKTQLDRFECLRSIESHFRRVEQPKLQIRLLC
jgi:hypothetical protein